ncbi:MAG: undecaprenyl-diphosphate phosphatase [Lactobacillus sp.]|jgi:undecaprenyl-diphosphatase|nr:undecaprenyl-diphosphate phosphatase [Lactobacillus sp.]
MRLRNHHGERITVTDINIILLSMLQGLTEFLPVSSSGHLVLFSKFTTFPDQGLAMDVAVHLGSILAVIIYFWEDVWKVITGVLKTKFIPSFKNYGSRVFWLIFIGSIPAGVFGFFLTRYGTEWLRDTRIIGWNILGFGILLYIADKLGMTIRKIEHLTVTDAIIIGIAQAFALIPGTSRSGITITMSRFLGMERKEAAKFSMLLAIPTICAAGFLTGYDLYNDGDLASLIYAIDGITYSFISSIIAIYLIMWWLGKSTFLPFVIYRIILGVLLLLHSYEYLNF